MTEQDLKPTGKELFMKAKSNKDFLFEAEDDGEDFKEDVDANFEYDEEEEEGEEEVDVKVYDKDLFEQEAE